MQPLRDTLAAMNDRVARQAAEVATLAAPFRRELATIASTTPWALLERRPSGLVAPEDAEQRLVVVEAPLYVPKRPTGPVPDFEDPDEFREVVVRAIHAEWKRLGNKPTLGNVAGYFCRASALPSANADSLGQRIRRAGLKWRDLLREGRPRR